MSTEMLERRFAAIGARVKTSRTGRGEPRVDVRYLAHGLIAYYRSGDSSRLDRYSERCLRRIWLAERFSWWMTSLLHRFPDTDAFGRRMQAAELTYLFRSPTAQKSLAENYVGLPLED